jgi:methylmalonyl-CoA mutase N-terminal domain/subunit
LEQIERLKQVKAGRDPAQVAALLGQIEQAAQDPDAALMPLFVEAVAQYVTLGEICGVLRGVFGEYQPDVWV